MQLDTAIARDVASRLLAQKETIAVTESSTGGLVSAQLVSIPGASGFYLGGSVVYTLPARTAYIDVPIERTAGFQPLTAEMVALFAEATRRQLGATWCIAELGAAGPSAGSHGDAAGTSVIAIDGPVCLVRTVKTGSNDREQNMWAFASAALNLLLEALKRA
jgi:nicotinamide-nucleotide amidase